jgi:hypothetical protein
MGRPMLEVEPEDERLVAIVRHMAVQGLSQRQIVGELQALGISDCRGDPIPLSVVWGILRRLRGLSLGG